MTVRWPARSTRLLPLAAETIHLRLTTEAGDMVGEALLARPAGNESTTATARFENLPLGSITVAAIARPNPDGSGVTQAQASASFVSRAEEITPVHLTLASSITRVEVTPADSSLGVGASTTLIATAKNGEDEIVLANPSTFVWSSSTPEVATVDSGGQVQAIKAGTATITVKETESGVAGSASILIEAEPPASDLILYDGFEYAPAGAPLTGQAGGIGWTAAWASHGPGSPSVINDGGLSFSGLRTSGNAYRTTSRSAIGDERPGAQLLGEPNTVRYYSLLIRPTDLGGSDAYLGGSDAYLGIGISSQFVGKGGRQANFGIEQGGGGGFADTGIRPQVNVTYFLVARATYGAVNDTVELWINPTPGRSLPAPNVAKTVPHSTQITNGAGLGAGAPCIFDELRVGTTWESVSPSAP